MSNQRTGPSQMFGAPHPPVHQQHLGDHKKRQETRRIEGRHSRVQELEAKYSHLPPLPPQLPRPLYMVQGAPIYCADPKFTAFYEDCSKGKLSHVHACVQTSQPSAADLAYALEEACQNFQPEVVRLLLQQPDTQLHYRCFRRCPDCPDDDLAKSFTDAMSHVVPQSIFTSGHSRLLDLLKVLLEFGWHPNQLLGPPQKGKTTPLCLPRQEVALHYPRCILDLDILRFLLDAGADSSIARYIYSDPWIDSLADQPVQRMSGDILEMAVNLGAVDAVTLLISRNAGCGYGIPLHSLARRRFDSSELKVMDETYKRELWQKTPELQYPTLSTRLTMAKHLLDRGEDINRPANVYPIVGRYCQVPTLKHDATALSHAKNSMDWEFVQWLLQNGAKPAPPAAGPPVNFDAEKIYSIGESQAKVDERYQTIVNRNGRTGQPIAVKRDRLR